MARQLRLLSAKADQVIGDNLSPFHSVELPNSSPAPMQDSHMPKDAGTAVWLNSNLDAL